MADPPTLAPEDEQYIACPCCTIQIPAGTRVCPHCRLEVPEGARQPPKKKAIVQVLAMKRGGPGAPSLPELWSAYGKWVLAAVPVLIALVVLYLVYGRWSGHKVVIVPNPELPIAVTQEKKDDAVLLRIVVRNDGEDVLDLSLRSIGVVVEIRRKDGRTDKKTVFPKSDFHGEGALLRGESGAFELRLPAKGIQEISLRSEIVDLSGGRRLIPAGPQGP